MTTDTNLISTPFVRFSHGTPIYPPNDIHEAASKLLKDLENCSLEDVFRKTIISGNISGQRAVLPEATWYAIFQDFLNCYAREFSHSEHIQALLIELLRLMSKSSLEMAWKEVEQFLLDHIDLLSGWSKCWLKDYITERNVHRGSDGNYYFEDLDAGTLVQIEGLKTLSEARLDFLIDAIFHSYGLIKKILDMFSLFAISKDFESNSRAYPSSLRYYLPEPRSGMSIFKWHRDQFGQIRSTKWRPPNNLCDSEWLSEELGARLTDGVTDNAWSRHIDKYSRKEVELNSERLFQIDYVLDTNLKIGSEEEFQFKFEGKYFRWINGTYESKPILSVGFNEMNNYKEAEKTVNQLLSFLVYRHQIPIRRSFGARGSRRNMPLTWGPRLLGGVIVDSKYIFSNYIKPCSDKKEKAFSFYKEGLNSESVFYKFFNFWKILELLLPKVPEKTQWIKQNIHRIRLEKKRVDEIISTQGDIVEYLFKSGRCAIAHVTKGEKFIDPDDAEDNSRISKDVHLMEELARMAIANVLLD